MTAHTCSSLWQCIFGYQTLIAGILAIAAAAVAAFVAWLQLRRMTTQVNALAAEGLRRQIARIANSHRTISRRLEAFDEQIRRRMYEFELYDNGRINPHWAHEYAARATTLLRDLRDHREIQRLPVGVDTALVAVLSALQRFADSADAIHRPGSMDQQSEDHSFSDEQWQQIADEAAIAETELPQRAAKLTTVVETFGTATGNELAVLCDCLAKIDQRILAGY